MRDIKCQPRLQIGKKSKENNKRRSLRKGQEDIDPAQARPMETIVMVPHGHTGRSATRTPPESRGSSHSPPRTCYASLVPGTTPLPTTMNTNTTQSTRRRKGGPGGKVRRSAAGGSLQAPSPGKTTAPLTMEEMSEGTLTEEAIRAAAGRATTRELHDVTRLALVIDSSRVSVEGVWDAVPNLHTLTLDGSRLLSFRDLGVGLRHLNTLSLESSFVEDLDGIGALSGLRELRLAHNRVSDVTPLACHASLQILDLERNRVSDMNALEILSSLPILYSLNLSGNPLMESLGKLRDGRGRGVVHKLTPQIKILDGTHLSSRAGGPVDAQTLDEADDLICQGASRARAAWAGEEETAAAVAAAAACVGVAGENGRRREEQRGVKATKAFPAGPGGSSSSRTPTGSRVAAEVAGGGPGSPRPPRPEQGGMMHWDSDLTQGGRQALSGNPSSAIRRHKWGRGASRGQKRQSPTRVLETLDLAKVMEKGLKQRHNTQQSAEKVSEWRRETCSDSVPERDPPFAPLDASVPPSRLGALPLSSSALEGGFDRQPRLGAGGSGIPATNTWASLSTGAASASVASAAVVDEGETDLLVLGTGEQRTSSGRPWTTGGLIGRSTPASTGAASEAPGDGRVNTDDHGRRRRNGAAPEEEDHPGPGGGQKTRAHHPRRRRPQTTKEPGKRSSATHSEGGNLSWQPVWESLQTAELISTPRVAARAKTTAAESEEGRVAGSSAPGGDGASRKMGSVDFGRQRRARATARVARGQDTDYTECDDDAYSTQEEEEARTSGGDDSEEAGDRAQIKKRALEFSSSASGARGPSCRPPADPAVVSLSPPSPPAMTTTAAAVAMAGRHERRTNSARSQQQASAIPERKDQVPPKARRRETAGLLSRRSLAVMDNDTCSSSSSSSSSSRSSSEDEGSRAQKKEFEPLASGVKKGEKQSRKSQVRSRGGGDGLGGARDAAAGGSDGGGGGAGGWSLSPRRESSIHASRMLGFDLRKSLAAIDVWTDNATTIAASNGCGSTPPPGGAKNDKGYQQAPFFIEHTTTATTTTTASSNSPFSPASRTSNRVAGREVEGNSFLSRKADRVVVAQITPPTTTPQKKKKKPGAPPGTGVQIEDRNDENDDGEDDDDDDDDGEAVLSVAAARAALGISKEVTPSAAAPCGRSARGAPSMADVEAIAAERNDLNDGPPTGGCTAAMEYQLKQRNSVGGGGGNAHKKSGGGDERRGNRRVLSTPGKKSTGGSSSTAVALPGVAVGMSDEELKGMLKQQPRTVPELRTKENFREFFQGMEAQRMSRLLRGAYEGNLPADQVDKKVKKRLGLVGDILAW